MASRAHPQTRTLRRALIPPVLLLLLARFLEPTQASHFIRGTLRYKVTSASRPITLPGAIVRCMDNDVPPDSDDFLCQTTADMNGNFACQFSENPPCSCGKFDFECKIQCAICPHWDCPPFPNPDVQCSVIPGNAVQYPIHRDLYFTPEISDANPNQDVNLGVVTLYPDRRNLLHPGTCRYAPLGTSNGCGPDPGPNAKGITIRDVTPQLWFAEQCNNHDCCYSQCGMTKEDCDDEVLALMLSRCAEVRDVYDLCAVAAHAGYLVTTTGSIGVNAFNAAQQESKCNVLGPVILPPN